jgi:exonuclease SbcC
MRGFGAFREDTEVDFTDIELAALVGPTGSGKSTIIDGVTFALFGSVARYDNASLVAPIINSLAQEARVSLEFEAGGERYMATRVVSRTAGGATTREARLERGDETLAGRATEMTPAVESLLGLNFDRFTKTVVLPQGRFAQFLHDKAGDRQELLRHLLDLGIYTRMGNEARSRAGRAGAGLEELEGQLETSVPSEEEVADLKARAEAVQAAEAGLESLLDDLDGVVEELEEARATIRHVDPLLRAVSDVAVPEAVTDLADRLEAATDAAGRAEEWYSRKREVEQEARRSADDGPDLARSRQLLGDRERLQGLDEEYGRLESEARRAAMEAEGAREAHAAAEALVETTFGALDRVRSVKRVESLVAQLREGEPCPVCRQTVTDLPDHDIDAELAQLRAAHSEALTARGTANDGRETADKAALSASTRRDENVRHRAQLTEQLSAQPDAETLNAMIAGAEESEAARSEAEEAAAKAEAELIEARTGLQSLKGEELTARQEYGRARDGLAALRPPEPAGSLLDDWNVLVAWSVRQVVSLREEADQAGERESVAERQQRDIVMQARNLCTPYLEAVEDAGRLRQDMAVAADRAKGDHLRAVEARKERADLEKRIQELREVQAVMSDLGRLLRSNGFERWLLEEAVVGLVERANAHLTVLSGGQYSFVAEETSFNVCDHHNADEVRGARTLSGGETFLASLSLALALRDSQFETASEGGARLDSLFLDEGFGTLDPDALDVVTGAIEELSSHGRMVCVVTHIREVAERMPVRFEVSKGATTSSVERKEA